MWIFVFLYGSIEEMNFMFMCLSVGCLVWKLFFIIYCVKVLVIMG